VVPEVIIPSHQMTLFGPRITIFTKDGKSYTRQATGREFIWDFDEEVRRIRPVTPALPIPPAQFERLIAACRDLDRQPSAAMLVQLTIKPWRRPLLTVRTEGQHTARTAEPACSGPHVRAG
jgi:hypothetical protein